jgi:hypothetical protein
LHSGIRTLSAWAADGALAEEQRTTTNAGVEPRRAAETARGGVGRVVERSGRKRSACVEAIAAAGGGNARARYSCTEPATRME